jgi:hypothetical protein
MLIQLPESEKAANKVMAYLTSKNIEFGEEQFNG